MIDPLELKQLVEFWPDLVHVTQSTKYPDLCVLKYKKRVFYDNLWDEHHLLVECRGLVVDSEYGVVAKPYSKIFNYGENGTRILADEMCFVSEKIDGFMCAVTPTEKYGVLISTTVSLDSPFVQYARDTLGDEVLSVLSSWYGYTFMFEIVHPDDPHIIPEACGAYLLDIIKVDTGRRMSKLLCDTVASQISVDRVVYRPEVHFNMRFSDVVKLAKTVNHEGFIVYGKTSDTALKIKSPYYLMTKLFGRGNPNTLLSKDIRRTVDEEFYPVVDWIHDNSAWFRGLTQVERVNAVREFITENIYK